MGEAQMGASPKLGAPCLPLEPPLYQTWLIDYKVYKVIYSSLMYTVYMSNFQSNDILWLHDYDTTIKEWLLSSNSFFLSTTVTQKKFPPLNCL